MAVTCAQCHHVLKSAKVLQQHRRRKHSAASLATVAAEMAFTCTTCGKAYETRKAMTQHVRLKHGATSSDIPDVVSEKASTAATVCDDAGNDADSGGAAADGSFGSHPAASPSHFSIQDVVDFMDDDGPPRVVYDSASAMFVKRKAQG